MRSLHNKKILLIMPCFFNYVHDVIQELLSLGAHVDFMADRPFDSPFASAITKVMPGLGHSIANSYYYKKLDEFSRIEYDYILVVNGQTVSTTVLMLLRKEFPTATLILYMWDSIYNRPKTVKKLCLFDRVLTFDTHDAMCYSLHHRPLFFTSIFEENSKIHELYNICFIGTLHSDRYRVISSLKESIGNYINCYWYLYLRAKWVYYYYKFTSVDFLNAKIAEFKFSPLNRIEINNIYQKSHSILDVEHISQNGLTMRTFEALVTQKKLVTTNNNIADYEFFSNSNICILDRNKPIIPRNFFNTPFEPLPQSFYSRYSIKGWVSEILDLK